MAVNTLTHMLTHSLVVTANFDAQIDNASGRVDVHDRDGWRGTRLSLPVRPDSLEAEQGIAVGTMLHCPATTHWLPTGDFLCPRCVFAARLKCVPLPMSFICCFCRHTTPY